MMRRHREQNTLEDGAEQLALAFDEYGVNFIDTYVYDDLSPLNVFDKNP
jgi:hypothetical protein